MLKKKRTWHSEAGKEIAAANVRKESDGRLGHRKYLKFYTITVHHTAYSIYIRGEV